MGRTVKVCGTPTAIPLEVERDESEFKLGHVLQTTQNGLIVMGTDESLCVVDAQKFCAGIVDVRHLVELPSGATFIRRKSTDGTGIAWKNTLDDDGEWACTIYIVDFQTGDVAVRSLPHLNEMAANIFVDNKGEQVAVVGATSGKLHGWSLSDIDYNRLSGPNRQFEWRIVDALTIDTTLVRSCSCWRYVSSAVTGNCFVYLRARSNTNGAVVIEKWILDVESNWLPVACSSRTLTDSDADSTEGLALFISEKWTFVILTVGKVLYHFDIDQDLTDRPVKRLLLDHNVLDGAWIDQDSAFAILFMNGQISIASVDDVGCFELLGIETSNTLKKRLSLSALLGKAVPAALQLVWVEQEKQLIVDLGETCSGLKFKVVDEESSNVSDGLGESIELCPSNQRMRTCISCDDYIRELLESESPPSLNDLLDASKFALTRSQETFEDSYFMVLSKVHRQLADDFTKARNCPDPIDWVGKSLKLMEVLVSFTISVGGATLWQISSKILSVPPGCTTLFERKLYYRKEIEAISFEMRKMTNGSSEDEDWWMGSMEVTAFLRVYFITIRSLLQDIQTSANLKPAEASQILSQCQCVIEHQDMLDALPRNEKCNNLSAERLKGLLVSYTIICCCLRVNGVVLDLVHLFSLPHINLKREEFVCCFLKPWKLLNNTPVTKDGLNRAVALATQSNVMQLLMNFCMESKSLEVHSCVQALCTAAATMVIPAVDNILQAENLHWQACETYIGEAMAILHRIGPRRIFKYPNREAECISGCLSEAIDSELGSFLLSFSVEPTRTSTTYHATTRNNSRWEFSRLDDVLRARVTCLISRVLWHLETSTEDIGDIFQHAFAMVDTQSTISSENQLYDCLQNVRLIINPIEKGLRLPRFRQIKYSQVKFCCRAQTIARSLVLVTWALWLREKTAFCSRYIRIESMEQATTETKTIGALAATCALSINTLGMIYGENEGLQTIQLSLLEDAAALNPSKTAAVITWGFPKQTISTRYLKRYMMLRQAVQRASVDMSLEDKELHLQQLRTRVRSVFHHFIGNFENEGLTEIKTSATDVLAACCCDQVSLQIMSVLAKCPCDLVDPGGEKTRPETSTPVLEFPKNSRDKVDSVTPSPTGNEAPCLPIPLVPDSLISRDEVIALLQAQTKQLEEKMQAVSISGRSTYRPSSHEDIKNVSVDELPVSKQGKTRDNGNETAVRLADSQRMARVSLQVRDLRRHRYSSASSGAEVQSNPLDKSIQRHDSVRNALKLFRLRQENCVQPPSEKIPVVIENEGFNVENGDNSAVDVKTVLSAQSPALSTRHDKLQHASAKRKSSRNQRCSENQGYSSTEPVYPLRLEYGVDNASLKLLGRSSQQYNPSVKKRQFVHQHRERRPKTYTYTSNADVEVIQLKTVSAQTNNSIEPVLSVSAPVKGLEEVVGSEQDNLEPEKGSPVVQECEDIEPVSKQKGVGIQCRMTENGSTKGARKRGSPSLKIADKFPIWVDLNSDDNIGTRSHFKERKKFLQVAGFGVSDTVQHFTNNDATEGSALTTISSKIIVHRGADGSEENQSDSQHSPCSSSSQAQDDLAKVNAMKAMYRARYKEQYPYLVRNRVDSKRRENEEEESGINSLIDLRDDMQRMTQRLHELEKCANSIDEEFKVSQKRLSRIGDARVGTSQSRMLQDIDEVLEMTEEDHHGERKPSRGLLSKNASSNLNAAKKLLGTIEQLAISADD